MAESTTTACPYCPRTDRHTHRVSENGIECAPLAELYADRPAAVDRTAETTEDEPFCGENYACEMCGKEHPIEVTVYTDDGCHLCPECDARFREAFAACDHDWVPHVGTWGPGSYCQRCHGFVEDQHRELFDV